MSRENVEIVRQIFAAWNRREPTLGAEFLDPGIELDATQTEFLPDVRAVFHGHDGVRSFWRTLFSELADMDLVTENFIDAGESVLVQFSFTGRGRKSGAPFQRRFVNVYTLRNSLVIRLQTFDSLAAATQALGI